MQLVWAEATQWQMSTSEPRQRFGLASVSSVSSFASSCWLVWLLLLMSTKDFQWLRHFVLGIRHILLCVHTGQLSLQYCQYNSPTSFSSSYYGDSGHMRASTRIHVDSRLHMERPWHARVSNILFGGKLSCAHAWQIENQINALCTPTDRNKAALQLGRTVSGTTRSLVIVMSCVCAVASLGGAQPLDVVFVIFIVILTLIGPWCCIKCFRPQRLNQWIETSLNTIMSQPPLCSCSKWPPNCYRKYSSHLWTRPHPVWAACDVFRSCRNRRKLLSTPISMIWTPSWSLLRCWEQLSLELIWWLEYRSWKCILNPPSSPHLNLKIRFSHKSANNCSSCSNQLLPSPICQTIR